MKNIINICLGHPKIDLNMQNEDGNTALHMALYSDEPSHTLVQILLNQAKINPNLQGGKKCTALIVAAYRKEININIKPIITVKRITILI
jgi:ankyrin repeat protein